MQVTIPSKPSTARVQFYKTPAMPAFFVVRNVAVLKRYWFLLLSIETKISEILKEAVICLTEGVKLAIYSRLYRHQICD